MYLVTRTLEEIRGHLEQSRARHAVFEIGAWEVDANFEAYVEFASGKTANNKLDMELPIADFQPPAIQNAWLDPMTKMADAENPDALWGIPSGGQSYATRIGERLGKPVLKIVKGKDLPGHKTYELDPEAADENEEILASSSRFALFEDAISEFTSVFGALYYSSQLRGVSRGTELVIGAWRRGNPAEERKVHRPVQAVITEEIPNIITPKHPFFKKYGKYAVMRQATVVQSEV